MLRCVAAVCAAAFLIACSAVPGGDTDMLRDRPTAAAFAWRHMFPPRHQEPLVTVAAAHDTAVAVATDDRTKAGTKPEMQQPIEPHERPPTLAKLDPAPPPAPLAPLPAVPAPFGLATVPLTFGNVLSKWAGVEADIRAGNDVLARCGDDAQPCPQAARKFLAIIAEGRAQSGLARIGTINRAVNMAIEPMSDMAQWGVPDRWSAPLETFTTGRGDCEDYAIAKYVALTAAGVASQDVKLIVVRNTAANEDHAVVAVRNAGEWIILDNRWLKLVKDVAMPKAIPLLVLDETGVREFLPPAALAASQRAPAPASTGS